MFVDVFVDAIIDCVKMLPFLLAAFLVLEAVERYSKDAMNRFLTKTEHLGPVVGALLGCIPQCGFSVLAANLFSGRIITLGTMIAVFMATSDEAVLILLGNPGSASKVLPLISVKLVIGILAGYGIDLFVQKREQKAEKQKFPICHCGQSGLFKCALRHTIQIFLYLLVFTAALNLILEVVGLEALSGWLLKDSFLQPFLAGVIGLIPNCAASVILTQLYLEGVISFASVTAGLCAGAGVGLVVLHRMNKDKKENWKITGLLYGLSVCAGLILQLAAR